MSRTRWFAAYQTWLEQLVPAERVRLMSQACWISTRHRLVYIDNPKAASTRLKQLMQKLDGKDEFASPDVRAERPRDYCARLGDFRPEVRAEILFSPAWRRFTFVRNPYVRLLSGYLDKRTQYAARRTCATGRAQRHMYVFDAIVAAHDLELEDDISFEQFIDVVVRQQDVLRDVHWRSQARVLGLGVVPYDWMGAVETFTADFETLEALLGGPLPALEPAVRTNAGDAYKLADHYDARLAERVAAAFAEDFARLGYRTGAWRGEGQSARGLSTGRSFGPAGRTEPSGDLGVASDATSAGSRAERARFDRSADEPPDPDDFQAHARHATGFEELRCWAEAASAWAAILKQRPSHSHARRRLIVCVANAELPHGATHLEAAIAAAPPAVRDDAQVAALFLRVARESGEPGLALTRFGALPEATRGTPDVRYELCAALDAAGQTAEAVRILSDMKGAAASHHGLLRLRIGLAAKLGRRAHGAALLAAVRAMPDAPGFAVEFAEWVIAEGRAAGLLVDVINVTTLWPHQPVGWLALGRLLLAEGRHGGAEQAFARALHAGGQPFRAELGLADCERAGGRGAAARRRLERLGRAFPGELQPRLRLAALDRAESRPDEAREALAACEMRFGPSAAVLHQKVRILLRERCYWQARELLESWPGGGDTLRQRRYSEAELAFAERRYDDARAGFLCLTASHPGFRDAAFRAAGSALSAGDAAEAGRLLATAASEFRTPPPTAFLRACANVCGLADPRVVAQFRKRLMKIWSGEPAILAAWFATLIDAFEWAQALASIEALRHIVGASAGGETLELERAVLRDAAAFATATDVEVVRPDRLDSASGGLPIPAPSDPQPPASASLPSTSATINATAPGIALKQVEMVLDGIARGEPFSAFGQRTEPGTLHDLLDWGLLEYLLAALPTVSLIAWHERSGELLAGHFGVPVRQFVRAPVPAEHAHLLQPDDVAEVVMAEALAGIDVQTRGEVYVIAASTGACAIAAAVMAKGGIALDLSEAFDIWLGFSCDRGGRSGLPQHARLALFNRALNAAGEVPWPAPVEAGQPVRPTCYWVNLDGAVDRAGVTRSMLSSMALPAHRVDAIDGERAMRMIRGPLPDGGHSPAELGNLLSHLEAMRIACLRGDSSFVVLEDDVQLLASLDWPELLASAPADWEILQLHVSRPGLTQRLYRQYARHGEHWVPWTHGHFSTALYAVRASAAKRLLSRMSFDGVSAAPGGNAGNLATDSLLYRSARTYTVTQPVAITRDFASQITPATGDRFRNAAREARHVQILARCQRLAR